MGQLAVVAMSGKARKTNTKPAIRFEVLMAAFYFMRKQAKCGVL